MGPEHTEPTEVSPTPIPRTDSSINVPAPENPSPNKPGFFKRIKEAVPSEVRTAFVIFMIASAVVITMFMIIIKQANSELYTSTTVTRDTYSTVITNHTDPPIVPLMAAGFMMIVLTAGLWLFIKKVLNFSWPTILLSITYTALIVLIKFVISPYTIYKQQLRIETGGLSAQFDPSKLMSVIVAGVIILGLYLLVYSIIHKSYLSSLKKELGMPDDKKTVTNPPRKKSAVAIIVAVLGIGFAIFSGVGIFALLLGLIALGSSLNYFSIVIGATSFFVLLALIAAIAAFYFGKEDAKKSMSILTYASFFYVGFLLLLSIHILWVLYMALLAILWPFNVTYYSSK